LWYKLRFTLGSLVFNPSGRTMTLRSTQPLTEMSITNILLGGGGEKVGRCVGLTTLSHSCAGCLDVLGASNVWSPQVLCKPVQGVLYISFLYDCVIRCMLYLKIKRLAVVIIFFETINIRRRWQQWQVRLHSLLNGTFDDNKKILQITSLKHINVFSCSLP
jgi:hypothetical protein